MQWLSADDVVRNFFDELWREQVERVGKFAVRKMITVTAATKISKHGRQV